MKLKGLLVLLVVLGALGYFLYPIINTSSQSIDKIIPETASIAIKVERPKEVLNALEVLPWFDALEGIPLLRRIQSQIEKMDFLEQRKVVQSKVSELPLWISLHKTASDDLTPLFVLKSKGFEWNNASLLSLSQHLLGKEMTVTSQNFNSLEISVLEAESLKFSTLIEGDFLILSQSSVLVEDVVRAIQEPESRLLQEGESFQNRGDLSVVLNSSRLNELESVFFTKGQKLLRNGPVSKNILFDITFEQESLSFNGSGNSDSSTEIVKSSSIFAESFVPISANSFAWQPIVFNSDPWSEMLNGDLCIIEVDRNREEASQVYILSTADTSKVSNYLKALAEKNLNALDSAIYKERYINSNIGYVNDASLMNAILSNDSDDAPYYTVIQDLLIISDDLDALKSVLNDFDNEATWGRSVERRRLIDDMIQETDMTLVKDFEFAADPLKNKLKPKWKDFFEEHPEIISVLDIFKVQVNRTNRNVLVAGDLSFNQAFQSTVEVIAEADKPTVTANMFADAELTTKPYVVRNHVDASREIVFQDSDNYFYQSNRQGEVLWKKRIDGEIKGGVHQVDFYNNKKLQYLFFTDSLIHLIHRNGDDVDDFPKSYEPSLPIDGSEVIDYDNNKRYRYLTKDRRGNLYLFGKSGDLLEGWAPKPIGGSLLETPFHIRVRGRDCFVVIEQTGRIHLLNRRGEEYNGFPVNIDKGFSGDVAFVKGSNFSQSLLALSTADGELIKVDLNGALVMRKQLLRASTNSEFMLVDDALKTTFSIARNNGRSLTIFDNDGDERFTIDYPNSKSLAIDQYSFRNGKEVFAIRDIKRQVVSLVDREGRFLGREIPSSEPVSILFYQNRLEYEVFVNFANQLNIYALKPF